MGVTGVYVLECEEGKLYVGSSESVWERISSHFGRGGTAWTDEHPPEDVVLVKETEETREVEKRLTLLFMSLLGWENVRGYAWSSVGGHKPHALRD